ncbi:MAG TPA: 3'-5' exonuclease KapD [Desulfobacteria bacterium]|nr:3'-5' exonuclease KapD [Desulfobacteria bacterium]
MSTINFLAVDFEFTVYTSNTFGRPRAFFPEVIEVGAVVTDEFGKPNGEKYSAFVKPRFWPRLTDECFAITGIRQSDVDNGVPLEVAIKKLKAMTPAGGNWLVAWGDADRKVLGDVCRKYGLEYPFVWADYVDLATSYRGFYKLEKRAALQRAIEERNIVKVGISHSALDDAINAALVMEKMINEGWVVERADELARKTASGNA